MMAAKLLLALLFLGSAATALLFWLRTWTAKRSAAELICRTRRDLLSTELLRLMAWGIDNSLLLKHDGQGLNAMPVAFREMQDQYRNLAELAAELEKNLHAAKAADLHLFIKALFQLQASLEIPFAELRKALDILELRLIKSEGLTGKAIARVEIVKPGTMLDLAKMQSITAGTMVKQPLGVVTLDAGRKVIGKARVVCQ